MDDDFYSETVNQEPGKGLAVLAVGGLKKTLFFFCKWIMKKHKQLFFKPPTPKPPIYYFNPFQTLVDLPFIVLTSFKSPNFPSSLPIFVSLIFKPRLFIYSITILEAT